MSHEIEVRAAYDGGLEEGMRLKQAEVDHWKSNHADMVKRCAMLRERPDLPVDRIPQAKRYQAEIDALEKSVMENVCDECQDENGNPTGWIYNRVEGKAPCTCAIEFEPYQVQQAEIEVLEGLLESGLKQCSKECMDNCVNYMGVRADATDLNKRLHDRNAQLDRVINENRLLTERAIERDEQLVKATEREVALVCYSGVSNVAVTGVSYRALQQALAETPAQSLSAYKNQVIEEGAASLEKKANSCKGSFNSGIHMEDAETLRSMKDEGDT